MATPPTRASISGTPSRAIANTGFGALWDYVTGLLGSTGNAAEARTALGLADSGPYAGLRNLIINGNFAINQRGYVSGTATIGANQYTLDRWRVVVSGQAATFTALGNGNLVTAPAGGLEQVIEGRSIAGGTYVISWTGTATCTVGGTARTKGSSFTLTANTNVTVRFSGGTVGEVQVEPGTVVTPFEARPYGLELGLCKRYYQWGAFVNSAGVLGEASEYFATYPLRVEMRAAPTVTITANPILVVSGASLSIVSAAQDNSSAVNLGFGFVTGSQPAAAVRIFGGAFNANAEL